MIVIKQFYREIKKSKINIHVDGLTTFAIYKGFKVSKTNDEYLLQDVRSSDFYDTVKPKHLDMLKSLGFIKGADTIVYNRDLRRVQSYTSLLEKLYKNRKLYEKQLTKDKVFYEKKIKNTNENILKNIDLLFFYKTRVNQFNNKYNQNE